MKHLLPLLLLASLGCSLSEKDQRMFQFHREQGLYFYEHGYYDRAQDQFDRAISYKPKDRLSNLVHAYCMIMRGDLKAAETQLRKAEEVDPTNFRVFLGFGYTHFLYGMVTEKEALKLEVRTEQLQIRGDLDGVQRLSRMEDRKRKQSLAHYAKAQQFFHRVQTMPNQAENILALQNEAYSQIKLYQYEQAAHILISIAKLKSIQRDAYQENLKRLEEIGEKTDPQQVTVRKTVRQLQQDERSARLLSAWAFSLLAQNTETQKQFLPLAHQQIQLAMQVDPHRASDHLNIALLHLKRRQLVEKEAQEAESGGNPEKAQSLRDEAEQDLKRARSELGVFIQKNKLSSPELNIQIREVIQKIDQSAPTPGD